MSNLKLQDTPFFSRYKMFCILNYGVPYKNYKTYDIRNNIKNKDNIAFIYVDNQQCSYQVEKPLPSELSTNALYYIEIHYTRENNKSNLECIMSEHEISDLLGNYIS